MELAGSKMQKWYKPKDIKNAIKLNNDPAAYAKFKNASSIFFKLKDVYNASVEWKLKNPHPALLGAGLKVNTQ